MAAAVLFCLVVFAAARRERHEVRGASVIAVAVRHEYVIEERKLIVVH